MDNSIMTQTLYDMDGNEIGELTIPDTYSEDEVAVVLAAIEIILPGGYEPPNELLPPDPE